MNSIAESTEAILKAADIEYETLDDEKCCGSVLLRTGFREDAISQMRLNARDLEGRTIVTSCAGCYKTLKEDYKDLVGCELDVMHISQLLDKLIEDGRLKLKANDLKVTYHDPCHLGRHAGEFEAPRNVISSISDLVEMEKDTGADLLVSACPFCKLNLSENSNDLEVLDLSEFVLNNLDCDNIKEEDNQNESSNENEEPLKETDL